MNNDGGTVSDRLVRIETKLDYIQNVLDKDIVLRAEFTPVKNIVYGLVTLILTSVVGAIIALVLKQK